MAKARRGTRASPGVTVEPVCYADAGWYAVVWDRRTQQALYTTRLYHTEEEAIQAATAWRDSSGQTGV